MKIFVFLVALTVIMLPFTVFAGGSQDASTQEEGGLSMIDWNKPASIYDRVAVGKYVLPEGWKQAIGNTKELTFINSGSIDYDPAMAKGMEDFTRMTGIKLTAIEIGEELLHTKQSAMLRAKSPKLDLVFTTLSTESYYDYQMAGWLEPCDFLVDEKTTATYPKEMVKAMTIDGQLWGFPYIGGAFIFGYRQDLFTAAGINPPKTWADLVTAATKLTKDGMYGFAFAAGPSYDTYGTFCSFLSGGRC